MLFVVLFLYFSVRIVLAGLSTVWGIIFLASMRSTDFFVGKWRLRRHEEAQCM
jgi:hypothetical protein